MTHLHAMNQRPDTFGAGTRLGSIRPSRTKYAFTPVLPPDDWLDLIDEVCARRQVHRRDVLNGWKSDRAVQCRNEIWFRLRAMGVPLEKIGMQTGGFHHTTVMYGVRQWAAQLQMESSHG